MSGDSLAVVIRSLSDRDLYLTLLGIWILGLFIGRLFRSILQED